VRSGEGRLQVEVVSLYQTPLVVATVRVGAEGDLFRLPREEEEIPSPIVALGIYIAPPGGAGNEMMAYGYLYGAPRRLGIFCLPWGLLRWSPCRSGCGCRGVGILPCLALCL
jgi:hypothetical protein